jgi:hypothetical protein
MPFTLPTFNLSCNIWRLSAPPPGPPALSTVCNLAFGRRLSWLTEEDIVNVDWMLQVLLPAGTDIRASQSFDNDVLEVPSGSGCFYHVACVADAGKGFANEHRVAGVTATHAYGAWPTPYP